MRLAAKALADMPLLILSPILPVVFYAALMVYCVAIGLFLASSGDFDKETFSSVPSACSAGQHAHAACNPRDVFTH